MPFQRKNGNRGRRGKKSSDVISGALKKSGKPAYSHQKQLTEDEVGITQYISDLDGYSAVIKARFSDFQVNEINLDGKVAKLTDTSEPKSFASLQKKYSYEDVKDSPLETIPQETWDALKGLVASPDNAPVELDGFDFNKEQRKCIHDCVKSYFGQDIVASTLEKDGKTILTFRKPDKNKRDTRSQWPENCPEFVYFILYKEMMDTMNACFKIAHALKIPPTKISYAGIKDRRAKTSQWCCIKKYEPSKIVSKTKHIRNIKVGNFEFKENCIKIGQLKGNRFRIALRNVIAEDDLIISSLNHLKEHGFINYYGLQRFGNDKEVPTFSVGIKLLQGQWKEAVDLILKVKAAEDPNISVNIAKKTYAETGNAAAALKACNKKENTVEKLLLQGLAEHHENDYVNALEKIPRSTRLMYIHAYQSLIWNKMASKRVQEFGLKPVEGDLIFAEDLQEEEMVVDDVNFEIDNVEPDTNEVDIEASETKKPLVRPLKADELNNFTIFDIVLPLPGYDVIYPDNLKQYYKEAVEECGLTLEMPKQKVKSYNLSGAYRKLAQHAKDLEWKVLYYNDPTYNLIRSDVEELNGEEEPASIENGKYKALVVAFTLSPSSYATMVLRELLKCNTSSSAQAALNNYGEDNGDVKPKVIVEESSNCEVHNNGENHLDQLAQQGSLLADTAKYEQFKSSVFGDILGTEGEKSEKRDLEPPESDVANKKRKTDE